MGLEVQIERVREVLISMMRNKSFLKPKGLIDTIATELGETPLTVQQCMGRLAKENWLQSVSPDGMPYGQVKIVGHIPPPPPDPELERWLSVMTNKGIDASDKEALAPLSAKLGQFSCEEQAYILEGLLRLRSNIATETGRHRYVVSADYFLGSSKLLDELSANALRKFGITVENFPGHPQYVVVAGCQNPETVILIENPAAFELAISTDAVQRCAFIATFGFGLSKSQEEYGNQLARMVEGRFSNTITLKREGATCPTARELLNHPHITFWGDLDVAGIQIYLRLKKSITKLKLSALYRPMVDDISTPGSSHPYVKSVGKLGQTGMATATEDGDALRLLDVCRIRGIDQETIQADKIEKLAALDL